MDIDSIIDKIYKVPAQSKAALKEIISEVAYPKGHHFLWANKTEKDFYFRLFSV